MASAEAPVLVVGGRTTGLMMAAELARHGVRARLVDRSPGIDPHARATLVHSRTLEIFQSLGIADAAREGSFEEFGIRIYVRGELVGDARHAPIRSPFPYGVSQSQAKTEEVLEAHLNRLGGAVERGVSLAGLEQSGDRVVATLEHGDGRKEIVEASYLIGCDGAHSAVRHMIDAAFPGDADPHTYLLGDVTVEGGFQKDEIHLFFHDEGDFFVFTGHSADHRLVCANVSADRSSTVPPTLDELQGIAAKRSRPELRLSDPSWLSAFKIHYRLVPHYRQGRVFLAGDAAHIHSLVAGLGMNTGIQDAYNLAWKLALVMRGRAPEWWLDTYETERRAAAKAGIAMSRNATESLTLFANVGAEEREKIVQHMFIPEVERRKAAESLQQVDLDYRGSPLCVDGEGAFGAGPHPGAEAPSASPLFLDREPRTLFEIFSGTGYRALLFCGRGAKSAPDDVVRAGQRMGSRRRELVEVFVVAGQSPEALGSLPEGLQSIADPELALHGEYGADSPCLYLIRPDGYVAYRSRELDSVDAYFARVRRTG